MVAATGSGLRNARPALSVTLGSRPPSERSGFLLPIADRGIHFAARALRNSPENRHTKLFALLAPASTRSTPTNSGHYDSFRRRLTESLGLTIGDDDGGTEFEKLAVKRGLPSLLFGGGFLGFRRLALQGSDDPVENGLDLGVGEPLAGLFLGLAFCQGRGHGDGADELTVKGILENGLRHTCVGL